MVKMKIGKKYIGDNEPVFIIAEAGVNHNGDENIAFRMIEEAANIGADAIKFQTFLTEETVSPNAPLAEHHLANINDKVSHFQLIKKLELPLKIFAKLKKYAEKKGIIFISTPYDIISLQYLISIKTPAIKIASGELGNTPLIDSILRYKMPIILSTGMNDFKLVYEVAKKIIRNGNRLAILKCTSNYPVDYENVNLLGIITLKKKFANCVIGFSDHSRGYEVACASIALGARIIEKHFTLDKRMWGPDHKASIDIKEFKEFMRAIRNVEKSLGSDVIRKLPSEEKQIETMKKSIYSRGFIPKGGKITIDDLMFLRPSGGISPSEYKKVIGKKTTVEIKPLVRIEKEFLSE